MPPKAFDRFIHWYLTRIYIHVRPERIYVWADGDASREPRLFDAHMEEVRSGHTRSPTPTTPTPAGGRCLGRAHGRARRATRRRP